MNALDIVVFIIFAISVVAVGLIKSRGERNTSEDYFLAGRGLTWPLIGFSLIAANISAEQMVGMAGQAANPSIGLAIASYEWMAAITLVAVGFFFLPKFLRAGIYTIPQYLEFRFGPIARTVMSLLMVVVLCVVAISTVTYLGAKFLDPYVNLGGADIIVLCWIVGIVAAIYVAAGGLKACAWADLIQGAALIVGGAVITVLAIQALGDPDPTKGMNTPADVAMSLGVAESAGIGERLASLKQDHMHMFLPATNTILPWTALLIGLWIPNFYYWGLNQYIMQRALGSKSLAEGQKGIVFAAGMKLIIPFVVCVPGIIAFTLYSDSMAAEADTGDQAALVEQIDADLAGQSLDNWSWYLFDGNYATREPERAEAILQLNAGRAATDTTTALAEAEGTDPADGEPRTPGEVLAAANDAVVDAGAETMGESSPAKAARLVGYDYDDAFPVLVSKLAPSGLKGFVIAAVMGAVVSSLASMLNAASTIFTVDIFSKFIKPNATQGEQVWTGRVCVVVAAVLGCLIAPFIDNPVFKGAFTFIQEFQGFISPGILTIFLFGLFVPRAPRICGVVGLVLSPIIYGVLFLVANYVHFEPESFGAFVIVPFLNRLAITVGVIAIVLAGLTAAKPMTEPLAMPEGVGIELHSSKLAKIGGIVVIVATIALYIIFR